MPIFPRTPRRLGALTLACLLTACGGGGSSSTDLAPGAPGNGGNGGHPAQPPEQRPAPAPLGLLVPAYFHPTNNGAAAWAALTAATATQPAVRITAILNPSNGPSTKADPLIARAASDFTAAGGRLVGYVHTRYGNGARTLGDVRADIDAYLAFYGRGLIQGFFLDEMDATGKQLPFYRVLHDYIKAKDSSLIVVGNPGTIPVAGYGDVADMLVTFEGKGSGYAGYDPRTPAFEWLYTRSNATQAALVHNVADCPAMQAAVRAAASARYQAGWVYFTDRTYEPATGVGNPWAGLPGYWGTLVQTVRSVNTGQALPPCP